LSKGGIRFFTAEDAENAVAVAEFIEASKAVPELVEGRYSVFFTAEDAENAVAVAEFIEASKAVPELVEGRSRVRRGSPTGRRWSLSLSTAVPELVEGAHPPGSLKDLRVSKKRHTFSTPAPYF